MDGSNSAFLFDIPFLSPADEHAGGILYVEDFDCDIRPAEPAPPEPEPPPALTQSDLDLARSEGFAEGVQSASVDAAHSRAQLETAAMQSLCDSLAVARGAVERIATHHASECARAMIAVMLAAVPATMARYGAVEVDAMLAALMPALLCEPELRVRAHPGLADAVRERLADTLPSEGIVLSVVADAKLGHGDVEVAWQHGQARRDCKAVWNAVRTAVDTISLPTLEELCLAHGS